MAIFEVLPFHRLSRRHPTVKRKTYRFYIFQSYIWVVFVVCIICQSLVVWEYSQSYGKHIRNRGYRPVLRHLCYPRRRKHRDYTLSIRHLRRCQKVSPFSYQKQTDMKAIPFLFGLQCLRLIFSDIFQLQLCQLWYSLILFIIQDILLGLLGRKPLRNLCASQRYVCIDADTHARAATRVVIVYKPTGVGGLQKFCSRGTGSTLNGPIQNPQPRTASWFPEKSRFTKVRGSEERTEGLLTENVNRSPNSPW